MENLESENVSLKFQVQSLIKERENVKTEYQKLCDLIKRTRTQTHGEINELIENVNQNTYAYVDVRAQNKDLLITISELKSKLKNVEKVKKSLFTTPRIVKSQFEDTTPVVSKTRFSVKTIQSTSLDTTPVISKTKIVAVTPLSAKHKVSSAFKLRDRSLSNYMKNKIRTIRMWQKWYELQLNVGWSIVKMPPNVNSRPTVVQIVLWIIDSGCSKHITGDRSPLNNFVENFMGTVRFGNDHFTTITGYGDYVQGNITICHVYYVEGLVHNLFSVGQFCDDDLEVAFRLKTCYVRNLEGDDLLTGDHETPEIIKNFIARVQLNYNAKVCKIRTDNDTEFKNATLKAHVGIKSLLNAASITTAHIRVNAAQLC
ncbi:hypothetical protein Tco_1098525 [Tanacetum coccineum]